jgi:hypothetical protein
VTVADQLINRYLPSRHTAHYVSLGAAGLLVLGSAARSLLVGGVSVGVALSLLGGSLVVGGSGYALGRPDQTAVGGLVWLSVVGVLLLLFGATVTLL